MPRLETFNNQDIIVRDYTDNFSVKNYIMEKLIPDAFPNIPMNKLNLGFHGLMGEMVSQVIEDSYYTSSLLLNENFITTSILPNSIYAQAGLFDLGYTFAAPSRSNFAVQLWIEDVIDASERVDGTSFFRYVLDKDTKIILGRNVFTFDYDVVIQHKYIDGSPVFTARYDVPSFLPDGETRNNVHPNSISIVDNDPHINSRQLSTGWLVLFVTLQAYERNFQTHNITDNIVTTNSDIYMRWSDQIAGFDLTYIHPTEGRSHMKKKIQYSEPEIDPFVYYSFFDDNTIRLMFTNKSAPFFRPVFNSEIDVTIYTCHGAASNFEAFNRNAEVAVQRTAERFEYNASTRVVALNHSSSVLGANRKDIEMLRSDVRKAYNSVHVLSTDHDLDVWFHNFAQRHNTRAYFFKRRDDPTGRLFSQFVMINNGSAIFPTNTLAIEVKHDQFDYVIDDNAFVIKPGHLWQYGTSTVTDEDFMMLLPLGLRPDEAREELEKIKNRIREDGEIIRLSTARGRHQIIKYHMERFYIESRDTVEMVGAIDSPYRAFITDDVLPMVNESRPFMFVNPFYIQINRVPQITSIYNYLINHSSYPFETYLNEDIFYHFQLTTMTVERSLCREYKDMYRIRILCVPIVDENLKPVEFQYIDPYSIASNQNPDVEDPRDYPDFRDNNLRLVLVARTARNIQGDGRTGYIEMRPVHMTPGGTIEFEAVIAIHDNLLPDNTLLVDIDRTEGMYSLIRSGPRAGSVVLDAMQTRFEFVVLIKPWNAAGVTDATEGIFGNPEFGGWETANKFRNDERELDLYKPMTMMRSVLTFTGEPGAYDVRATLMPMLKWDLPLNREKMSFFMQAFTQQYAAVEPVLFERLDNNSYLDVKLFNTYGMSNNYFIGPTNDTMLDSVHIRIAFNMGVRNRTAFNHTAAAVRMEIKSFIEQLNSGEIHNIYISNLIKRIETNHPNVHHLKFLGMGAGAYDYDANKQYIRLKYQDITQLQEDQLHIYVPEILQIDIDDIDIFEEVI